MLADAAEAKLPSPQAPPRRVAAPSRGLLERAKGWLLFNVVDGRSPLRARANAPFEQRGSRGYILVALVPGFILLLAAGAIFWRPIAADPAVLSAIPIDLPSQTPVERQLIRSMPVLREGIWEARLPPWLEVPTKGMARVSNPDVHAALASILVEIAGLGDSIANRASPGLHRDQVLLGQIADLRRRLVAMDAKLGGMRSITAYHLGLLALWAGDPADAEPQFTSVIAIARQTKPLDNVGRQRLDGIQASAAYGLGLAEAGRGLWQKAITDFDVALAAACHAAADSGTNTQGDFGFALGRANLVALDTRSIRNDRLVALLNGHGGIAVTSPTCSQLLSPSERASSGDADAEARALSTSLPAAGDPTLAANLQLRNALMGNRDIVQQLSFDGAGAPLQEAQNLARAIVGLEQTGDAGADGVDQTALADLQRLSVLKSKLAGQLRNATLSEPESDPAWTWSDPTVFTAWKAATASTIGSDLLVKADNARLDDPGLSAALYNVVIENDSWLPETDVFGAWWRMHTGVSPAFALTMLAIAAAVTAILLLMLRQLRRTYRVTFMSWHHSDRLRAPDA